MCGDGTVDLVYLPVGGPMKICVWSRAIYTPLDTRWMAKTGAQQQKIYPVCGPRCIASFSEWWRMIYPFFFLWHIAGIYIQGYFYFFFRGRN